VSFMSALPSERGAMRWQDAGSATERRRRLFDDYVASRTSPGATDAHYSREPMLRWLRQLAVILKHRSQPEFLIERMQPDWLDSSLRRWCYCAGVLILSATAVYAAMSGMSALFELVPRGSVGLALQRSEYNPVFGEGSAFDLMVPYLIAVAIGSLIASRRTIVPIETLTWSWPRAYGNLRRWAQTGTFAALDYGMPLSVLGCCVWYLSHIDLGDHVWQRAGEITGITGGLLVAAALTLIRPSTWLARERPAMRPRMTYALAAAAMCTIVTGWGVMWIGGLVSGLAVFLVAGFSGGVNDRCREMLPKWLIAAAVSGATVAGLSWGALSPSVPPLALLSMWVAGAVAAALIAVVAISLAVRFGEWWRPRRLDTASGAPGWVRTGAIGLAAGVLAGLLALLSTRTGSDQPIRAATIYAWYLHSGLLQFVLMLLLWGAALTTVAAVTAGVFGALAGALSGATGADVERRLTPNQGIRQSALNILVFAALGMVIVGIPYGLVNMTLASITFRRLPDPEDWLRLGVGAGSTFGILAGLLPGAACIQHVVLRLVLWASGTLPLRCVRFFDFATRRRLLQRVGGRYRFIHVLIRDHLADALVDRTPA
jgi:hypothetical protein